MAQALPLPSRVVAGALAGTVATAPMTAVMRRLHAKLERDDQYPLPPREIIGSIAPGLRKDPARDTTIIAHFAYGALCGAALATALEKPTAAAGAASGVGIWLASYLGWIPAFGVLRPASRHPGPRNALMILAHVAWGSAYALAQSELVKSRSIFEGRPLKDIEIG